MITRVIALSFGEMKNLVKEPHVEEQGCFISISGSTFPMIVFSRNSENIMRLCFDDRGPGHGEEAEHYPALFAAAHADKIIEFMVYHHVSKVNRTLYVNCAAGVSRSGAVATFVNSILNLDKDKFRKDNPRVSPNSYVLQTLNKRWEEYGVFLKQQDAAIKWTTANPRSKQQINDRSNHSLR